jgi:hypothetical protein
MNSDHRAHDAGGTAARQQSTSADPNTSIDQADQHCHQDQQGEQLRQGCGRDQA